MLRQTPGSKSLEQDLRRILGSGAASIDDADRVAYARDLWPRQQLITRAGDPAPRPPGVIVWPSSAEEVAAVVRYATEQGVELVPYGAGSGVCGGIHPEAGAILLDVKRMRSLLEVDPERLSAVAQAGIIGQHLEDELGTRGFTLGHFPSSIYCSTLGGWVAGRSAGQCSGRYGKIEDMVTGLTCVDGRGEILRVERGGENAALLPLVIGSEGILAVVTEATLRIAPAPTERRFTSFLFDRLDDGLDAIRRIYQAGLRPAVARLYDPFDSMIARRGGVRTERERRPKSKKTSGAPGLGLRALTSLLRVPGALNELIDRTPERLMGGSKMILVWESEPHIADAELARADAICRSLGARDTGEGPARHWLEHRHSVSYRQSPMLAAGAFVDTMEVAATWSRLMPMYEAVRRALSPHAFVMAHFSHAYPDGASIYFTFAGSGRDDQHCIEKYDRAWKDALAAVIEAGGTLSHHHGVGRSKAPAMRREQGVAVDVVRELKRVMDPSGILNPGALVPMHQPPIEVARRAPEVGARIRDIDGRSRIAHVEAGATLKKLERALGARDLTLGLSLDDEGMEQSVGAWLDAGMHGTGHPDDDPVAQRVAGLAMVLPDGRPLELRPAPRRAVGPDLIGATVGSGGALGTITEAHLIVRDARVERDAVAGRFDDHASAEAARAWIRGLGVTPARTDRVSSDDESATLRVELEGDVDVVAARREICLRVIQDRGGEPIDAAGAAREDEAEAAEVSERVRELAAKLMPAGGQEKED